MDIMVNTNAHSKNYEILHAAFVFVSPLPKVVFMIVGRVIFFAYIY